MIALPHLSPLEHGGFVAAGLLVYVVVTRVRHQRRHPYAALAWVMAIIAFPYLGVPAFLLFGTRKFVRPDTPRAAAPHEAWAALTPHWATQLLAALGVNGPRPSTDVAFQADGESALVALQALIGTARQTLDICTYVLGDDEVGAAIAQQLADRARAGVRVRLLVDAAGSLKSARSHDAVLLPAGVNTRLFMPPLHNPRRGRTNLRNHRKFAIADGQQVWSGGRNLANEYFIGRVGEMPWLDLSFTARGALAEQAQRIFDGDWQIASGGAALQTPTPPPESEAASAPLSPPAAAAPAAPSSAASTEPRANRPTLAQWVPSGPDFHDDTLHALLLSATYHAQWRLMLATPYFVPDEGLLDGLRLAATRGVRITLVLPAESNHRLADWARGRAVRTLVEAGVQVRLVPAMMHAKAVVVDDELALCGSANLDSRSLFINYEASAAFYGTEQIDWLAGWIASTAERGQPASAKPPSWWRDVAEGIVATVAFQL